MILSCSKCATRYLVDPAHIGPSGRQVRCAKCAHEWWQDAPAAAAQPAPETQPGPESRPAPPPDAAPKTAAEAQAEAIAASAASVARPPADGPAAARTEFTAAPRELPQPDLSGLRRNLPAVADQGRARTGLGWVALAAAMALILGLGYGAQEQIVAAWPPVARLYLGLGLTPEVEQKLGIELRNLSTRTSQEDGVTVLLVSGQVVNITDQPRRVPPIRIAVRDAERREIQFWTMTIEARELAPRAMTDFNSKLASPPASSRELEVSFVTATRSVN